jgi:Tol biopolymer transport system component
MRFRLHRPAVTRKANSSIALGLAMMLTIMATAEANIVFSALQDGFWRLYYQANPAAQPQPIPTPEIAGDKGAPRFSPDGTQVAFEVTGGGLHVCPVQGSSACLTAVLKDGYPVRPAWNPRTGKLVFAHFTFKADEEQSTLKRADSALAHIEPVIQQTGIQDFPDISPDGTHLAYTSWLTVMPYRGGVSVVQQLWTLDLTRGRAGQLLLSNASDIHPRWSPDGSRLAFSSNRTGRYELWTVAADGSDPRQVTEGPGDKTWPAWSPDGARILFTHTQGGRAGLSLVTLVSGKITAYQPFGPDADIQLKDADWRAGAR